MNQTAGYRYWARNLNAQILCVDCFLFFGYFFGVPISTCTLGKRRENGSSPIFDVYSLYEINTQMKWILRQITTRPMKIPEKYVEHMKMDFLGIWMFGRVSLTIRHLFYQQKLTTNRWNSIVDQTKSKYDLHVNRTCYREQYQIRLFRMTEQACTIFEKKLTLIRYFMWITSSDVASSICKYASFHWIRLPTDKHSKSMKNPKLHWDAERYVKHLNIWINADCAIWIILPPSFCHYDIYCLNGSNLLPIYKLNTVRQRGHIRT